MIYAIFYNNKQLGPPIQATEDQAKAIHERLSSCFSNIDVRVVGR